MTGISTNGLGSNGIIYGSEVIAVDTGLTQGQGPSTQAYGISQIAGGLAQNQGAVVTGGTVTVGTFTFPASQTLINGVADVGDNSVPVQVQVVKNQIIQNGTPGATLAALAVVLPGNALDNSEITLVPDLNVTALAVTSTTLVTGGTAAVHNAPTAAVAGTGINFVFKGGVWYKK